MIKYYIEKTIEDFVKQNKTKEFCARDIFWLYPFTDVNVERVKDILDSFVKEGLLTRISGIRVNRSGVKYNTHIYQLKGGNKK